MIFFPTSSIQKQRVQYRSNEGEARVAEVQNELRCEKARFSSVVSRDYDKVFFATKTVYSCAKRDLVTVLLPVPPTTHPNTINSLYSL